MKEQFKTVNVGTFSELINLRQRFENFGVWTFLTEKTNKNSTLTAINCCLLMKYFAQEWMFSQSYAMEAWCNGASILLEVGRGPIPIKQLGPLLYPSSQTVVVVFVMLINCRLWSLVWVIRSLSSLIADIFIP